MFEDITYHVSLREQKRCSGVSARKPSVGNDTGLTSAPPARPGAGIPFVVAVPESTIDIATPTGRHIPLEQRADDEITVPAWNG